MEWREDMENAPRLVRLANWLEGRLMVLGFLVALAFTYYFAPIVAGAFAFVVLLGLLLLFWLLGRLPPHRRTFHDR